MKFEVFYPIGKETFCTQCGDEINGRYVKLSQNRWAKPNICKKCILELLRQIETGEKPEETKQKVIIHTPNIISKNDWMWNFR